MSAFILFNSNDKVLVDKSRQAFHRRGFKGERLFATSAGTLLLCPKQNVEVPNYYSTDDCSVYCVGTVVYKGLSYTESLRKLAGDFEHGKLDVQKLRGSFVLLFDKDSQVSILTDKTRMYRLFTNQDKSYLSTSLIVAASLTQAQVYEAAVVEQLLCGYVGGGQTMIKDISDVSFDLGQLSWLQELPSLCENVNKEKCDSETRLEANAAILHDYLQDVKALACEYGSECGLSGGCDSRLIFSSVNVDCTPMNSVHTHRTSHIHDKEIEVVKQLSQLYNVPLRIIPTTYLPYYEGDIDEVLRENVLYFDARNTGNIGAMSQTHTRKYKKLTSEGASVTFSGIGGEIYRNFYFTNLPFINVEGWLGTRLFEPGTHLLFPHKTYKEAKKRIARKIADGTGLHFGKIAFPSMPKRYFDSYRIPYALGNVVNANNQMSFYLAPFTENVFIEEAKYDRKYQDHCGSFEGKILKHFDPNAAFVQTSRGYNLSHIPHLISLKWKVMGMLPSFVWRKYEKRGRNDIKKREAYAMLKSRSSYYRNALSWFQKVFPNWSYSAVDEGNIPLNSFVFTVCALYELTHSLPSSNNK